MDAILMPLTSEQLQDLFAQHQWSVTYERRLLGPCSKRVRWSHDTLGTLAQETWSALLAVRFSGDIPTWFDALSPHPLSLEDLQAVVAAQIPMTERVEACVQTGAFFVERDLETPEAQAYLQWLEAQLNERAELQLAALEVLRVLNEPVLLKPLETLANQGTLYVRNVATQLLADLMLRVS